MIVTDDTNFCRVFELPLEYPEGYCFGGGRPTIFRMVDWFNPVPRETFGGGLPDFDWQGGQCELTPEKNDALRTMLRDFLVAKTYVKPGRQYLVLTDYGDTMLFRQS